MERIVIEVSDQLAKAWRSASQTKRGKISNIVSTILAKELYQGSVEDYKAFIHKLQAEMKEKGLTQEELDEILADG
jgi:hypothetical protein